jgi:hypothetical protein
MRDMLYVAGTVAFFALMLAYVWACAKLGRAPESPGATNESR